MKIKNLIGWVKVLAVPTGIWLILQIIFLPMSQKTNRLNKEVRDLNQRISQTYTTFGGERHLKDELVIRQAEFLKLKSAFSREQNISNVIKALSEEAKRHFVSVSSIRPGQLGSYIDSKGETVEILESKCRYLPVRVLGQARYRQIGEFLNSLKETFGFLVTVEELRLEKDKTIEPELKFELLVNTYYLVQ